MTPSAAATWWSSSSSRTLPGDSAVPDYVGAMACYRSQQPQRLRQRFVVPNRWCGRRPSDRSADPRADRRRPVLFIDTGVPTLALPVRNRAPGGRHLLASTWHPLRGAQGRGTPSEAAAVSGTPLRSNVRAPCRGGGRRASCSAMLTAPPADRPTCRRRRWPAAAPARRSTRPVLRARCSGGRRRRWRHCGVRRRA